MNDHNLDDLIIDNIDPKNSKTKSFLTIIALAIVVLIVAIILTKIILKDPNEKVVLEEDNTELISPELTLQNATKKETPTELVKDTLALEPKKSLASQDKPKIEIPEVKPETVTITDEFSQQATIDAQKEKEAKLTAEKKALEEKMAQEKQAALAKKEKELEMQKLTEAKAQEEAEAKMAAASKDGYFIQVGSFTKTPSDRFLSVIKNSGFEYQITPPSSTGTKKLLIGPYTTREEVDTALVRVRDRINKSAFVVKK